MPEPRTGYPSPAPEEEKVGYPSAAPQAAALVPGPPVTVPEVAIPPPVPPGVPPPPPPAARGPTVLMGPTDYPPGQQMPMAGETRRTGQGEQTFKAPDVNNADVRMRLGYNGIKNPDLATPAQVRSDWDLQNYLDRRKLASDEEVKRLNKAVFEDGGGLVTLTETRDRINRFNQDFPPDKRAYYLGTLRFPMDTLKLMMKDDPNIQKFHDQLAGLSAPLEGSSWVGRMLGLPGGSSLLPGEQSALRQTLPSGNMEPANFEARFQNYADTIDSSIQTREFFLGRPVGSTTLKDINQFLQDKNDARAQARLDAFNPPPERTPPTVTMPPTTTPPSTTPPTTAPPPAAQPWAPTATWQFQ